MNPFIIKGYAGPEYFCDRELETTRILNAIENQRNLTLVSLRKMGKTGLIYHVFNIFEVERFDTIYIDIYDTENLNGFINKFASSLLSLRKTLSGLPSASFKISSEEEAKQTIGELFQILAEKSRIKPIILAIDEFQQITKYPEKNVEALIRSHIQHMHQVSIIFSGSNKTLLGQIFANPSRPFYQSTELMYLEEISKSSYLNFIKQTFSANQIKIEDQAIERILDWTKLHTYYVQYVCNRLFEKGFPEITVKEVHELFNQILVDQEPFYFEFRNLLTTHQWQLLKAIAKEKGAKNITSSAFIRQYDLNSASTIKRGIDSLMDKELIYKSQEQYFLQDVFFSRWMELQD